MLLTIEYYGKKHINLYLQDALYIVGFSDLLWPTIETPVAHNSDQLKPTIETVSW